MKFKIPFLTRLLEIKEEQLRLEKIKLNVLKEIRDNTIKLEDLIEWY